MGLLGLICGCTFGVLTPSGGKSWHGLAAAGGRRKLRFWGAEKSKFWSFFDEILHNSASPQPKNLISGLAILIWSPLSFGDDGELDCDALSRDHPNYFLLFLGLVNAPWGSRRTPGESAHPGGVSAPWGSQSKGQFFRQTSNFCYKNSIFASKNNFCLKN